MFDDFVDKVEHFYVLLCPNTGVKSNNIKSAFSDFNKEFFSLETLTVIIWDEVELFYFPIEFLHSCLLNRW